MNANIKNSQTKKLSMPKICCNKKARLVEFPGKKKHLKNDQVLKLFFWNMLIQKASNINVA